jgi:putative NADH-flavin reductase
VRQALAGCARVTAFVRDTARLPIQHASLNVVEGNVADRERVFQAVGGQDVILSALGVGVPLKPDPVVVDGVRTIVGAMKDKGVRRLVYLSFIGVRESRAAAGWIVRHIARWPLRHETRTTRSRKGS